MQKPREQKIKIDLYDTRDKKYELRDTGMPEAAKHLGVKYNNFTGALYRGGLVKGRYQIIKKGFFPSKELIKDLEKMELEDTFEKRWNEAIKPFRILKERLGR